MARPGITYGDGEDIPQSVIEAEKRKARRELRRDLVESGITPKDARDHAERVVSRGRRGKP